MTTVRVVRALFLLLAIVSLCAVPLLSCSSEPPPLTDFEKLQKEYCETSVSEETIEMNFSSHFGVLHDDPQYYDDQIELGAPWERTVVFNMELNEIADGIRWTDNDLLLEALDTYVMQAQMNGIWLMVELYVFRPLSNVQRVEEVLKLVAERYDRDGNQDMPYLKYPVNHFGVGNELAGTWKGTAEDFLAALEICHDALSQANPEVRIVQAGLVPYNIAAGDIQLWDSLFSLGVQEYIDISVFHEIQGQENLISVIYYPTYFSQHDLQRPMWINEFQLENLADAPSLTQEQYAPIFIRYMTHALAHGMDKLFFANFKYPPPHIPAGLQVPFTEASALIDSNDRRTMLFQIVRTFIHRFDRFESAEVLRETIEEGVFPNQAQFKISTAGHYRFVVGGQKHYVLWGAGPIPAEIKGNVIVTDIFGQSSPMDAGSIVLTGTPIYVTAA